MNEKKLLSSYSHILKSLELKLGKGATNNVQLSKIGKQLIGNEFVGVYPQDSVPFLRLPSKCYFIINVDTKDKLGSHWIGIIKSGITYYIYDSFGRNSTKLLPIFSNHICQYRLKMKDTDYDKEQKIHEENCGQRVLSALLIGKQYGVKSFLKI